MPTVRLGGHGFGLRSSINALGHGNARLITAGIMGGAALMGGASSMQRLREQRYGSAALSAGLAAGAGYAGFMAAFQKEAFRANLRNMGSFAARVYNSVW